MPSPDRVEDNNSLRQNARNYGRGIKERFQSFATLNGLLAGFALAATVQLVAMPDRGWAIVTTIGLMFGSVGLLLGSTIICYMVATSAANLESSAEVGDTSLDKLRTGIEQIRRTIASENGLWLMVFGLMLLLGGVATAGWIVSPLIGVVSSLSSAIAFVAAFFGHGR